MIARQYSKQIEIWRVTTEDDPYGGSEVIETLITKSWAKLTTNGLGNKAIDMGVTQFQDPVLFQVRFRPDVEYSGKDLTVRYRGDTFIIQAVRVVNEWDREVELFCVRTERTIRTPSGLPLFVGGILQDDGILVDSEVYDLSGGEFEPLFVNGFLNNNGILINENIYNLT